MIRNCLRTAASIAALAVFAGVAPAQPHEQHFGRYVVRADVVHTLALPPEVLARHDLEADAGRALLNVVVVRTRPAPPSTAPTPPRTIRAYVLATVRDPTGYAQDIDMRPVAENGRVSFVGVIPIGAPRMPLAFDITVYPEDDTALTLQFSEILYRRSSP